MLRVLATIVVTVFAVLFVAAVGIGGVTAQDTVTLDVTVVDQDGEGVGGVELTATWDDDERTATTFGDGGVRIEVPAGTTVDIEVDHDEYVRNRVFTHTTATDMSREAVEIPVTRQGAAIITVEDEDGEPIEGATVTLSDQDGTVTSSETSTNGRTRTAAVERGVYDLRIHKPEYLTYTRELDISSATRGTTVTLERATVDVTFSVTDDHFDPPRPLEDARIEVAGDSITTRDDGQRTTDLRVNQRYDVTITKDEYQSYELEIDVEEDDRRINASIQRSPALNVDAANQRVVVGETVRIYVTNEYDEPVEGASVLLDGDAVTETDVNGQADVEIATENQKEITVELNGLSASTTVEGVAPGEGDDGGDDVPETDEDDEDDKADDDGAGFGPLIAVGALLAATLLIARR